MINWTEILINGIIEAMQGLAVLFYSIAADIVTNHTWIIVVFVGYCIGKKIFRAIRYR